MHPDSSTMERTVPFDALEVSFPQWGLAGQQHFLMRSPFGSIPQQDCIAPQALIGNAVASLLRWEKKRSAGRVRGADQTTRRCLSRPAATGGNGKYMHEDNEAEAGGGCLPSRRDRGRPAAPAGCFTSLTSSGGRSAAVSPAWQAATARVRSAHTLYPKLARYYYDIIYEL